MPVYKAVLFMDTNCRGYSEVWYVNRAAGAPLDTIFGQLDQALVKRAAMLGAQSRITAIRLSNADDELGTGDEVKSDARLYRKGYGGDAQYTSASPDLAAIGTMYDATGLKKRNSFLRGFFDELEINGGLQTNVGGGGVWVTRFNAWITEMIVQQAGWLSRRVKATGGEVFGSAALEQYNPLPADPRKIGLTFSRAIFSAAEVAAGRPIGVNFSQVGGRGGSRLNGPQVVVPTSQENAYTYDQMALLPFTPGGIVTRFTYEFVPMVEARVSKIGRRAAGNVSTNSVGRSKAQPKG